MRATSYIWSAIQMLLLLLSLVTNWYETLVYLMSVVCVLMVIDKLGKGIVLREIIALHCVFICLLMPLAGFLVYNRTNALAISWVRYMPIAKAVYFDYCLPAVIAFCLALCWPISSEKAADEGAALKKMVDKIKVILEGNHKVGIYLIATGIVLMFFVRYFPTGLQYVLNLCYFSSFAGILYIYFSGQFPYKKLILTGVGLFTVALALRSGMFTIIAYMGMTLFSFFFLGRKASMLKKLIYFSVCFFILALIQSIKPEYRKQISNASDANTTKIFSDLVVKKLSDVDELFSARSYFFLYYRANQGYNIALVMRRFPTPVPFDNGEYLKLKILAAFVPRLLWPKKPEAGGIANMKYYANWTIKGWSTNVGPLAEAYASFGIAGGILFMVSLGLFIRFAYRRVFVAAQRIPLVLLWIPVMFYQVTYSSENDTLQILNSLIKSSVFIFILYKVYPKLFKPPARSPENAEATQGRLSNHLQNTQPIKV